MGSSNFRSGKPVPSFTGTIRTPGRLEVLPLDAGRRDVTWDGYGTRGHGDTGTRGTMATTPEGKVKKQVSDLLKATPGCYYFMPVPGGFGMTTLDYVGCYRGRFFSVETKKPGGKPTPRQNQIIGTMQAANAAVFVIDGDLAELKGWLSKVMAETTDLL